MNKTYDLFLNGKLKIIQPSDGYRAATDPVFLAASIQANSGQTVLDIGSGVGVASLCLGARIKGLSLNGIELQHKYASMSEANAIENSMNLNVINANLEDLPIEFRQKSFDHVMTNPPFFIPNTLSEPIFKEKSTANIEILYSLSKSCGKICVLPMTARRSRPAKRVIVQGIKGSKVSMKLLEPFIVHDGQVHTGDKNDYSEMANDILRKGHPLVL